MLQSNYFLVCASVRTLSRYALLGPSECSLVSTARHASIGKIINNVRPIVYRIAIPLDSKVAI